MTSPHVSNEMAKRAAIEYLDHRGENSRRILRGGQYLWETHVPAMKAALTAALSAMPGTQAPGWMDLPAPWERVVDLWGRKSYSEEPRRFVNCRWRHEYMNNGDAGWYDERGECVPFPLFWREVPTPPTTAQEG